MPFPKSLAVPYAYRHSYCQRHADAGTPMDVLRDLMGHRSTDTTQIYYRITETRTRAAVEKLIAHQYDGSGRRLWRQAAELLDSEHARHRIGQIAVPFGICAEPSNVQAGGAPRVHIACDVSGVGIFVQTPPSCPSYALTLTGCWPTANESWQPPISTTGHGWKPRPATPRSARSAS